MVALGITKMYSRAMRFYYPCTIHDTPIPNEVEATLRFGAKEIYLFAPISKVDKEKGVIELHVIGEVGDRLLVSLPGEAQNAGSTITVERSFIKT